MGCKKRKFFQEYEAKRVLLKIQRDPKYSEKEKKESNVYKCEFCHAYHITSMSAKAFEKMKRAEEIKKEHRNRS